VNQTNISPFAIFSLLLMMFLAAIDTTILAAAMPEIVRLLGQPELYHWGFTAFMLCSTLALPFFGKWADQIGVRRCMLVAGLIFLLGSGLCTLADNMWMLIVGRAVQGLGAAGLQGLPLIAFGVLYPPEQRGAKQGLISIVWGFSSLAGPATGGFLVAYLSWRWIFGLNVFIGLVALAIFWYTFPKSSPAADPKKIDWPSAGLLLAGLSSLIVLPSMGLQAGASTLAYLLCFTLLASLVWRQRRIANPLVPLQHFASPVYQLSVLLGFTAFFVGFSALTYIPLYLQRVLSYSPEQIGLILTPMMLTWPLASALAGRWLNRLGFRNWAVLGSGFLSLSMLGWALIASGFALPGLLFWCICMGLGMGCLTPTMLVAAQSIAPPTEIGVASSTLVLLRNIGTTLGVSLMGALQIQVQIEHGVQTSLAWVFGCLAVFALLNLISSFKMPACAPAELERLKK